MQASIKAVFQDLGCSACAAKAMVEDQGIDTLDVRALYVWHHLVQVSGTILQIACTILATNLVWQTLISGTSQK